MNKLNILTGLAAALVATSAVAQWNQLSPTTVPVGRFKPNMQYDTLRGQTVMFGGGSMFSFYRETWIFDGQDWSLRTPAHSPTGRAEARMVYDPANFATLMFGGAATAGPFGSPGSDETWRWDGTDWTQLNPTVSPPGRLRFGAAFDSVRSRMVIYGGLDDSGNVIDMGDTWEFDGTTWAQINPTASPGPREGVSMCFNPILGRTVLYGGIDVQVGGFTDTWTFDGTNWTRLTTVGAPPARTNGEMVFDSARGVCVLQGGSNPNTGAAFNDTWEFDGTNWTQVASGAPTDHNMFAMAYDSARRNIVLFGGVDSFYSFLNETWEFGASFHHFGSGCSGLLANPAIANLTGPVMGTNFRVDMTGIEPGSGVAFMVFGLSPVSLDLSSIGMTGCTLHASSDLIFGLPASLGVANWTIPVPNSTSLLGARIYLQGMAQDPTANAAGLVLSAGAAAVIGR